jgi:single-stranded DNA-binding protein
MDTNLVLLTGRLVSAAERTVGQSGRTLVELRLGVARPGRKGEAEQQAVLPITIWTGDVGAAVLGLREGTPVTVLGRLTAREWNNRLYLELVGESVTVDVAAMPGEAAPPAGAEAPAPARRPVSRATSREPGDETVPF